MNRSGLDPVEDAKTRIREVTAEDAVRHPGPDTVLLDCREPAEYAMVHIPGALFLPLGDFENKVEAAVPKDRKVLVYCARGNRSAIGADIMQQMGYSDVASMAGGIRAWVDAGGEIES